MRSKATRVTSSVVFLVLLTAWTLPAFAEVQNVKVSGDLTVRGFFRKNLDLTSGSTAAAPLSDGEEFIMSTIGLNIAADLTENVSTFIRLANEDDWGTSGVTNSNDDANVSLSQGYVTLKELFYAPLTVKLGRQPIVWGRGLVLGSGLLPNIINGGDDLNTAIAANEFTEFTAFDALRATLDLSNVGGMNLPLTAEYVFIKLTENTVGKGDDVRLQGVNLSTKFNQWNSEAELYFLNKFDQSPNNTSRAEDGSVSTLGLRGSAQPVEGSSVWAELAYQFGTTVTDSEAILASGSRQSAWAANLGADYTFKNVATTPNVGGEWRFYSGRDSDVDAAGWSPIAPGYFTTALREFQTRDTVTGFYPNTQVGITSGQTNQHELALFGGLKPLEDLAVNSRLSWFVLDVPAKAPGAASKRYGFLGAEWDTQLKYDYTDDVQFGFLYALFLPGSVFRDVPGAGRNKPQELVTTVSVKF
ncbi:MAG: alginate export family protein [Candidatus Omnitrophica bacterium]|nr:alginate export family protein [Candidatus Omnitrophota bacterium]